MPYLGWGFRGNPFSVEALPASKKGQSLLVGRERVIEKLAARIPKAGRITTIEGSIGAGKTSLANVASYILSKRKDARSIYIPCMEIFQLTDSATAAEFKRSVLLRIAQTLALNKEVLPIKPGRTRTSSMKSLCHWINSPESKSISVSLFEVGASLASQSNQSTGFSEVGVEKQIIDWLNELFPDENSGGIVCVADNMELLRHSKKARAKLEELRDSILIKNGIRWILCGANGIFDGAASSARLKGFMLPPIKVDDFPDYAITDILKSRIDFFKTTEDYFLPVTSGDFYTTFKLFRGNLRDTLSACDDFCTHFSDDHAAHEDVAIGLFDDWLAQRNREHYDAVSPDIGREPMALFIEACQRRKLSYQDRINIGVDIVTFLKWIEVLEGEGLVETVIDDGDAFRKTFHVTSNGWHVYTHINNQKNRMHPKLDIGDD